MLAAVRRTSLILPANYYSITYKAIPRRLLCSPPGFTRFTRFYITEEEKAAKAAETRETKMRKAERAAELMHQIHELAAAREYIESLRELSTEVILTATDIPDAQEFYRQEVANAVPENDGSDKFINSRNPAIKAIFFEHDKVKQELRKSLLEKLTFKPEEEQHARAVVNDIVDDIRNPQLRHAIFKELQVVNQQGLSTTKLVHLVSLERAHFRYLISYPSEKEKDGEKKEAVKEGERPEIQHKHKVLHYLLTLANLSMKRWRERDAIDTLAEKELGFLKTVSLGPKVDVSTQLLDEIAKKMENFTDPAKVQELLAQLANRVKQATASSSSPSSSSSSSSPSSTPSTDSPSTSTSSTSTDSPSPSTSTSSPSTPSPSSSTDSSSTPSTDVSSTPSSPSPSSSSTSTSSDSSSSPQVDQTTTSPSTNEQPTTQEPKTETTTPNSEAPVQTTQPETSPITQTSQSVEPAKSEESTNAQPTQETEVAPLPIVETVQTTTTPTTTESSTTNTTTTASSEPATTTTTTTTSDQTTTEQTTTGQTTTEQTTPEPSTPTVPKIANILPQLEDINSNILRNWSTIHAHEFNNDYQQEQSWFRAQIEMFKLVRQSGVTLSRVSMLQMAKVALESFASVVESGDMESLEKIVAKPLFEHTKSMLENYKRNRVTLHFDKLNVIDSKLVFLTPHYLIKSKTNPVSLVPFTGPSLQETRSMLYHFDKDGISIFVQDHYRDTIETKSEITLDEVIAEEKKEELKAIKSYSRISNKDIELVLTFGALIRSKEIYYVKDRASDQIITGSKKEKQVIHYLKFASPLLGTPMWKIYDMQDFNKTEGLSLFIDSPFNSVLVDPLNKSH